MVKYSFKVRAHNIPCHLDIEKDLKAQKNGVFTFTLRVNQGNIEDYVNYSNRTPREYSSLLDTLEPECEITLGSGEGLPRSGVR